jgi:ADP-heptose:LPS heptosyltransferase
MKRNLILTDGGMGDLACQLVAVDFLHKRCPKVEFKVWLPDYLLEFARHLMPKYKIYPFSEADKKFDQQLDGRTTQWFHHGHTPMRTHPVDYGFHMLADCHLYDLERKNYLQIRPNEVDLTAFNLPTKYVCIVATAAEPVKAMPVETINKISDYVISRGCTPVYLGREKALCGFKDFAVKAKVINANYDKGINLLNQTSTLEAAAIMAKSMAVIGMDGGLIHIAGFTDTNIVAGYTLVDPRHVAPIRQDTQTYKFYPVEPPPIKNRYFQTNTYQHDGDYRTFPGWENIVKSMTPDKFIKHLEVILNGVEATDEIIDLISNN